MSAFLTVKEAAYLTGKSPSSIRRIIYPIIDDDAHPDRSQIEPSVEQAHALRVKGEQFAWKLSDEFLRRAVPQTAAPDGAKTSASSREVAADNEVLTILRNELDIKNEQIKQQMELIKGLSERLREGNILIGSLQQQLALPGGREKVTADAPEPKRSGGVPAEKTAKPTTKAAKKKSFLARLFG